MKHRAISVWRLGLVLPFLALASTAQADSILDQSNLSSDFGGINPMIEWQQQVTDGIDGVLAGVELYSFPNCGAPGDCPDTVTVSIGLGTGFFSGSFAFTTTAAVVSGGTFVDTSSADIYLTQGETFVIDVSNGQPPPPPVGMGP